MVELSNSTKTAFGFGLAGLVLIVFSGLVFGGDAVTAQDLRVAAPEICEEQAADYNQCIEALESKAESLQAPFISCALLGLALFFLAACFADWNEIL